MRTEVSLEEVKRQFYEINPKSYLEGLEYRKIIETATNFKIDVCRDLDVYFTSKDKKEVIRLTIEWIFNGEPIVNTWTLDLSKYISNKRKNKLKKLLK